MYQRILVPVDGSDTSTRGLMEAIQFAINQAGRVCLLHIVNEHVLEADYAVGTYAGDLYEAQRESSQTVVRDAEALVRHFGLPFETVVLEGLGGQPAPLIIEHAAKWGADLIVMGTHGRRGLRRLAMGSDAESVVRGTTIPVLLVHGDAKSAARPVSDSAARSTPRSSPV